MQCLPEIRKLPKIIASIDRIPKLIQIIVEHTTQYLAGSVAELKEPNRTTGAAQRRADFLKLCDAVTVKPLVTR